MAKHLHYGLADTRAIIDRYGLGSNPAVVMLLWPWERHFTIISSAWQLNKQFQITVIRNSIEKKINRTTISRYLRKQVGVIAFLCIAPLSLSCESGV